MISIKPTERTQARFGAQSAGARAAGAKITLICGFLLAWQIYAAVGGVDSLGEIVKTCGSGVSGDLRSGMLIAV